MRTPGPETVMFLSVLFPGAGHLVMGLRRRGALTALGFYSACGSLWAMTAGIAPSSWTDDRDLFFCCCWVALSLWFFAVADAWVTARAGGEEEQPNPRVAFILNFCTRGLGYFYLERPWTGCACLVGTQVALRLVAHHPWGDPVRWILALHLALACHAYALARRSQRVAVPATRAIVPPTRMIVPACLLLGTAWLSTTALSEVDRRFETRLDGAPQVAQRLVTLPRAGVSLTLPTQDWRFKDESGQAMTAVFSRRARIMVMSETAPASGLDGYILAMAANLTRRYGTVRLRGQHDLVEVERPTRELCYEWTDGGFLCISRVYLVECGGIIKTFLVDAPEPLDEAVHAEVEAMMRSVRPIRHREEG